MNKAFMGFNLEISTGITAIEIKRQLIIEDVPPLKRPSQEEIKQNLDLYLSFNGFYNGLGSGIVSEDFTSDQTLQALLTMQDQFFSYFNAKCFLIIIQSTKTTFATEQEFLNKLIQDKEVNEILKQSINELLNRAINELDYLSLGKYFSYFGEKIHRYLSDYTKAFLYRLLPNNKPLFTTTEINDYSYLPAESFEKYSAKNNNEVDLFEEESTESINKTQNHTSLKRPNNEALNDKNEYNNLSIKSSTTTKNIKNAERLENTKDKKKYIAKLIIPNLSRKITFSDDDHEKDESHQKIDYKNENPVYIKLPNWFFSICDLNSYKQSAWQLHLLKALIEHPDLIDKLKKRHNKIKEQIKQISNFLCLNTPLERTFRFYLTNDVMSFCIENKITLSEFIVGGLLLDKNIFRACFPPVRVPSNNTPNKEEVSNNTSNIIEDPSPENSELHKAREAFLEGLKAKNNA